MRNFIRTHSKKFLAVFGVILMVAFIMPTQNRFGENSSRFLVGHLGEDKVYDADFRRAKNQWQYLEEAIYISPEMIGNQLMSVVEFYRRRNPAFNLLAQEMAQHSDVFYLLQAEADRSGIIVLPSDMDEEFKRRHFAVRLPTGSIVALEDVTDPNYAASVRDAAAALIRVERSLDRARHAAKISRPLRDHELARQLQQIQLEVVEFSTADFLNQVPAPTPEDLKKHFDAFADRLPEMPPTSENPHGFGYKYPNRVTLQYVGVRNEDVRKAVLASKDDWEFQARKYYLRNPSRYPTTTLSTQPTTQPGLSAATQPTTAPTNLATTGPTTKPFEAVREEIIEMLIAPEIQRKSRDIQDRISTRLRADYDSWRAKNPTTQPTSGPAVATAATQPGDFTSFEYLQQVAKDIEQQTGVLPVIASLNQLQTAKDLQSVEGIGSAMLNQVPFAGYATEFAVEFVPPAEREKSQVLWPYKPSQVLRDPAGSSYVFRVTSAIPSGRPKSVDEVAAAVERDWRFARAYDIAKQRANAAMEAARRSSLASAAQEANRKSITTGTIDAATSTIENVSLPTPDASNKFRLEAVRLLGAAATQPTKPPLRVIELPVQGRVFVAQLLSAKPRLDSSAMGMMDAMIEGEILNELSGPIFQLWYDYNNVVARTGYRELTAEQRKENG